MPETEPKHTRLPWKHDAGGHLNTTGSKPKKVASTASYSNPNYLHDAAFIDLACNSHYELLKALKNMLALYYPGDCGQRNPGQFVDEAKAAVAKATP